MHLLFNLNKANSHSLMGTLVRIQFGIHKFKTRIYSTEFVSILVIKLIALRCFTEKGG